MERKLIKMNESTMVTLPKHILSILGWEAGQKVIIDIEKSKKKLTLERVEE